MQYDEDEDYFAGYGEDSGNQGVYSEDVLEDLEENDEISPEEEAFMEGYREAGVPKEKKTPKQEIKEEEKKEQAKKEPKPVNRKRKKSRKKVKTRKRKTSKKKTKKPARKREKSGKKR